MAIDNRQKAIVGVGNLLLSDEGVGVHCISLLQKIEVPEDVLLFDGGTVGFGLMDIITGLERMVLVDCVRGGGKPGTIYQFNTGEIEVVRDRYNASIHQVGICEVLETAALLGKEPRTTVIGVEPLSLDISMELSHAVQKQLSKVANLALKAIKSD